MSNERTLATRVRAILFKQGLTGYTKEQILTTAEALGIDINKPTSEDVKAVAKALAVKNSSMTISEQINDSNLVNTTMLNALPKPASYTVNKEKIVLQQAELLNISLSVEDAKVIASQIIAQSSDIQELIAEIKQALHAYIEHVKQSNTKEINQTITDVYAHANQANREVSDLFSTQCQNLAVQMEESRNHFKSSVRDFIKVFAIPQN